MTDLIDVYFMLDDKHKIVCAANSYTIVRDCVQNKLIKLIGGRNYKTVHRKGVVDTLESLTIGQTTVKFESVEAGYTGHIDYLYA